MFTLQDTREHNSFNGNVSQFCGLTENLHGYDVVYTPLQSQVHRLTCVDMPVHLRRDVYPQLDAREGTMV